MKTTVESKLNGLLGCDYKAFIEKIANPYLSKCDKKYGNDLIQSATVGLMEAFNRAEKGEYNAAFSFASFSRPFVKTAIKSFVAEMRPGTAKC